MVSLESPPTSSQNENKNNEEKYQIFLLPCPLPQPWLAYMMHLILEMKSLLSFFFPLSRFTSAIYTEVPARDLSTEPSLVLIQVYFWSSQLLLQKAKRSSCASVKESKEQGENCRTV